MARIKCLTSSVLDHVRMIMCQDNSWAAHEGLWSHQAGHVTYPEQGDVEAVHSLRCRPKEGGKDRHHQCKPQEARQRQPHSHKEVQDPACAARASLATTARYDAVVSGMPYILLSLDCEACAMPIVSASEPV